MIYFYVQFQGLSKIKMFIYIAFYNMFLQQLVKMKAKPYLLCSSENFM